jgi:uncharacterized caspase-like protein
MNEIDNSTERSLRPKNNQESEPWKQGRLLVVVIGIDEYQYWQKLKNAVNDAVGFQQVLMDKLGFIAPIEPLKNEQATKTAINSLVEDQLREILQEDDNLILFFAGHGHTRVDKLVDKLGDQTIETGYLIPVEASSSNKYSEYIEIEPFLKSVAKLPAKHILVILDSCHSGFALSGVEQYRDAVTYTKDLSSKVSRRVITSALREQTAIDVSPIPGHSLFTGTLINGFNSGEADLDGNGLITSSELGLFLQVKVGQASNSKQTPDFGAFHFDKRGEMVISILQENNKIAISPPPWIIQHLQEKFPVLIDRPQEIQQIVDHLLNEEREPSQNIFVLWGPEGYGKTALALLSCCVPEILQRFSGGIFWVDLGEGKNIVEGMRKLYKQLTGSDSASLNADDIATELLTKWSNKPCLIVLDDVRTEEELKKFHSCTSKDCTWLIITQDKDCLKDRLADIIQVMQVNPLTVEESRTLIYSELKDKDIDRDKLKELVDQLYEWPLLVNLVRKEISNKIGNGYTPNKAIEIMLQDVREDNCDCFKEEISENIRLNLKSLNQEEQEHFKELVIFPKSKPIPLSILGKLWGFKKSYVRRLCEKLYGLSLLQSYNPNNQTICLNNILRKYLSQQQDIGEKLSKIHRKLLECYGITYHTQLNEDFLGNSDISDEEKTYLKHFYKYHRDRAGLEKQS